MEECVRLVCETLGVHMVDEVSVEKIAALYQNVFHTTVELRDVQRAVTQVSAQSGGMPCSGRWILHVLLEMEKEREKREKVNISLISLFHNRNLFRVLRIRLFWELQMLKSGQSGISDGVNTHTQSRNSSGHKNGLPQRIISLHQSAVTYHDMYERSRTVVRCAVGQTEEFKVEVGLHQGSALSPFLFAIVTDQLSEEVRQESPWTMMFADDIVICSESREQVEENLERWRFALERRGMKVSGSKTEYMCVNEREGSGTVRLQGEEVKKVQEFKCLGSTVQSNGECGKEKQNRKPCGLSSLLGRVRRLYVRLDVDGVWSLLPSLSHSHVTSRRLGLINPTKSDVLLLLEYKYDIIKERLYREMLQEEHGVICWESMEPLEQIDCVRDLEQRAEEALNLSDVLCVCELPGVLHCYRYNVCCFKCIHVWVDNRSTDQVKVREHAWTSSPHGKSWTSAIFLSELHSHYDEERRSLTQLLNRPCLRLDVEDLMKFWLQEKQDPAAQLRNECRTSRCVRQQAVLQCVVQCQEQERRMLVEILHTVSEEELQEHRHTLTPDSNTAETTGWVLRRGCVSVLKQIKSSLQSSSTHSTASWDYCTVHLLTQLTHTHDQEVQTVIHTLPVMDAAALLVQLQKYELELRSPKLHNLHILLQTSSSENTPSNISVTVSLSNTHTHTFSKCNINSV
ncbi:hypothetical protein QTP70_021691 [Hemibagrus guttatus]|uniref:ribonuclease H n=1 Tax=Hemibagrus guttatus TaxID=175788 RepID=A0AAE0RAL5_9TELE|nr:hypothetical protein QTP70_021691 [Hemibagrus guttatus]